MLVAKPLFNGLLALKEAYHPIKVAMNPQFVPNQCYSSDHFNFHIVTGPNMVIYNFMYL